MSVNLKLLIGIQKKAFPPYCCIVFLLCMLLSQLAFSVPKKLAKYKDADFVIKLCCLCTCWRVHLNFIHSKGVSDYRMLMSYCTIMCDQKPFFMLYWLNDQACLFAASLLITACKYWHLHTADGEFIMWSCRF